MIALLAGWITLALAEAPTGGSPPAPPEVPDRSAPPAVELPSPIELPPLERRELWPGLTLHVVRIPGLREARVEVAFRQGGLTLQQGETAAFTAMTWVQDQATRRRSPDELASLKAAWDLDLWTDGNLRGVTADLSVPVEDLDRGLALLREVLFEPRFPRSDVRTLRTNMVRSLVVDAPTRAGSLIDSGLRYGWYDREHPLGQRPDIRGWYQVRRRHLRWLHRRLLAEAPVEVVVVADRDPDDLLPLLRESLAGLGVEAPETEPLPRGGPQGRRVIGIDLGPTSFASVAIRYGSPALHDSDLAAFAAVDHALGGPFLSRLNRELREERGLTYGIDSTLVTRGLDGHWTVRTEVDVAALGEALVAVEEILDQVARAGLTAEEIETYATRVVHQWNRTLSTAGTAASAYQRWVRRGEGVAAARDRVQRAQQLDAADTARVAEERLGPSAPRLVVVVGDRDRIEPQLEHLGAEVTWIPSGLMILGGP